MTSCNDPSNSGAKGRLFVISAPSGAGKSTLCRAVRSRFPQMCYSISRTTRQPRKGEIDGVDYFFVSQEEFLEGISENRWAEWAQVHDNYYGTSAADIDKSLAAGRDILLDIDVQGARQIVARYPDAVTIFIMPPSMGELQRRLESRGTDSAETIAKRLRNAQGEIAQKEKYRHIVVNDRLESAAAQLFAIIEQAGTEGSSPDRGESL